MMMKLYQLIVFCYIQSRNMESVLSRLLSLMGREILSLRWVLNIFKKILKAYSEILKQKLLLMLSYHFKIYILSEVNY